MKPRSHLSDLVDDFSRHGSQTAVVTTKGVRRHRTTYAQLDVLTRRFAAELDARDIGKGDRVIFWAQNSAEWIAGFFGCVLRGVLPVPLDVNSKPSFILKIIDEVSPRLIVADQTLMAQLLTDVTALSCGDLPSLMTPTLGEKALHLSEKDPLQIVFTSGTTGTPKGVVHTHANVLASLRPIETEIQKYIHYERLVHPLRFLHTLPLSHVFGQFLGLWIPALLAAEVHFASRMIPAELIARVRRDRISLIAGVPRVLDLLKTSVEQRYPDLQKRIEAAKGQSTWQRWWTFRDVHSSFGYKFWALVSGGASLASSSEEFWNALGFAVIQGYGMTETTALISLNHPLRPTRGTVGQVLPGRHVRIGDDGEVQVRGDTVAAAFWQNGAVHEHVDPWLSTGDLADFDHAGNLRFRGRKKDVIVTSAGFNIHPGDLEAALRQSPGVLDSVVVGQTGPNGPEPLAVMIMSDELKAGGAIRLANEQLADFQQVRRWFVWPDPDFPRTANGKVLRREVTRQVEARIAAGEVATDQPPARELALDSLGRVELQAEVEQRYGVTLPDSVVSAVSTDEQLRKAIAEHSGSSRPAPEPQGPAFVPKSVPEKHIYPMWPWSAVCRFVRTVFLECVAFPLIRGLALPRVARRSPAAPSYAVRPMLLVSNHITAYDAPLILYALPREIRTNVAVAMSGEMVLDLRLGQRQRNWLENLVAPLEYLLITGLFNVFPLPQASGFRESFVHMGEAADRGYHVLVFPEGRRSDTEEMGQFKLGAGLLWKELGADVLPIRIRGLGDLKMNRQRRWFRAGAVSITIGSPIHLDPTRSVEELVAFMKDQVERL